MSSIYIYMCVSKSLCHYGTYYGVAYFLLTLFIAHNFYWQSWILCYCYCYVVVVCYVCKWVQTDNVLTPSAMTNPFRTRSLPTSANHHNYCKNVYKNVIMDDFLAIFIIHEKSRVCSAKKKKVRTLDSCFRGFGPHQHVSHVSLYRLAKYVYIITVLEYSRAMCLLQQDFALCPQILKISGLP